MHTLFRLPHTISTQTLPVFSMGYLQNEVLEACPNFFYLHFKQSRFSKSALPRRIVFLLTKENPLEKEEQFLHSKLNYIHTLYHFQRKSIITIIACTPIRYTPTIYMHTFTVDLSQ